MKKNIDARQELVRNYPQPPRLERFVGRVKVVFNDAQVACSDRAFRVLETNHPPTFYIPAEHVEKEFLVPGAGRTFCEWKGEASYFDLQVSDKSSERAAWTYLRPSRRFAQIKGFIAFYAGRVDACFVDGEKVSAQAGDFYGGWITENIVGPYKG